MNTDGVQTSPLLDTEILRVELGPRGEWATRCGRTIRDRRKSFGWSLAMLASLADSTVQTIQRVETGEVVPRDYLRAAIAYALSCEVCELWPPLTRRKVGEMAA